MTDTKQELDPALVEELRVALFGNPTFHTNTAAEDARIRGALLSLGIPAAALNALWRGEAVVVPKVPTREIVQIISRPEYLADWEAGKVVAGGVGADQIPPYVEHQIATGQYLRLLAASPYRE